MASSIIANNVQVTYGVFAFGITAGVVTLLMLIFNGMGIGAAMALYTNHGVFHLIRDFVVAHSVLEQAEAGRDCRIGPFARLRPGARLGDAVHVGNYVEVKNSTLAAGAKANHLTYLGDATVGERVNVGAGTITCNYDGVNKHRTVIGAHVRTGSDTMLVAPVEVGDGAYTGAGTIVRRNVPPGALSVSGGGQRIFEGWVESRRPGTAAARASAEARAAREASESDPTGEETDDPAEAYADWRREAWEPAPNPWPLG